MKSTTSVALPADSVATVVVVTTGLVEGSSVGWSDGNLVGSFVGLVEGPSVVGPSVGFAEGAVVGSAVGDIVGLFVRGEPLGLKLSLGTLDGSPDEETVGAELSVGELDGFPDGENSSGIV